ncbi:MAG: hypothetical protein ACLUHE_06210 [Christensenellales bacterium]
MYGMPDDLLSFAAGEPLCAGSWCRGGQIGNGWRFSRWTPADGNDVPAVMLRQKLLSR